MNTVEAVKMACHSLEERLGEELMLLQIGKITTISDYFIIVTAKNDNHLRAMEDAVTEALGRQGVHPKRVEGGRETPWLLLDYGDFVIHIFTKEYREFYNLERIWADAGEVNYEEL